MPQNPDAYVVEAFKLGLCPVGSNPLSSSGSILLLAQ